MKRRNSAADKRGFAHIKQTQNPKCEIPTRTFRVQRSSFINFSHPRLSALICGFVFLFLISLFFGFDYAPSFSPFMQKVSAADDLRDEIEKALYTRQEFFGAEAIVPLPTAGARENLARLAENFPGNAEILSKLAELNEKLGKYDEAEANLNRLAETDAGSLENLVTFYHRRAQFEKEAMVLRKILFTTAAENRAAVFEKLIYTARLHDLQEYLKPEFYAEVAGENPNIFEIFQKLVEKLVEEKNYPEALKFLRAAKAQFPNSQSVLLAKEIEILLATNQPREAENVYHAAFNPFWSEQEAEKYYAFLSRRDRLRAYGAELKARFRRNPADFDAGVRLALYRRHDYEYGNDEITPIILEIESAKKNWTTEELVTATRLLLQANEGETASRFLYTLFVREDFRTGGDGGNFRAQILYQLFEMFSDAENQKLPLTKGDLRFYADAARADTSPGIATGILSLIFSDTRPQKRFDRQEADATRYFNRAAAYRIFQEYKKEFPASPELAQMYLDIVRLYTATKETEIAEKTLSEFAERYADSTDFPATALKLADALATTSQPEKEHGVYRKLLDYLGEQKNSLAAREASFNVNPNGQRIEITPSRNDGINIPKPQATPTPDYYFYNENKNTFRDYLARETGRITYAEVLEKLVASLAKERKTPEILELYSAEIAKYPDEEWLYERRLAWLETTDFAEEQLKVYQAALARFQSRGWQDKLARWFLRQRRGDDFAAFSEDLAGKLNDAEIQSYLAQFVDGNDSSPGEFEKRLYLKLYETAHARFPHNIAFVEGLLRFYKTNRMRGEWLRLAAEYYFESPEIREAFLDDLAAKGELRNYLQKSSGSGGESAIYELFRADAAVRLSNYENAIAAYRKLNEIYPNTPEFSARLVNFTRSLGQKNRELLGEVAGVAKSQADFQPLLSAYRTQAGEIFAELGDYEKARGEWEKLIATARGDREIYLETATVYWDYFQYENALETIKTLREKFADPTLYAFEAGAILEALHRQPEAIGEYVKALGARGDDYDEEAGDSTQKYKAKKRLANLFLRVAATEKDAAKNDLERIIETAYLNENAKRDADASFLALGYAELLVKIKQNAKAETILNRAISQSRDAEFLEEAKDFYAYEEIVSGRQAALKRLAETSDSPRRKISYHLQLAASFEETGERDSARAILTQTVRKFPTNFGVLTEASDFYWRLGFENDSIALLQNALPRSRGVYRARLAQKLSKRLIQSDRLDAAERILSGLHAEEKSNTEIFRELAGIYVRAGKPEALRKIFGETVAALRLNATRNEYFDMEIADLRGQMIDAFTRLKDYQSAIEQHVEIINREPENEQLTENAVAYAVRYGGAETLLNYYLKTSAEAFKNYRWNVVLARIYEARKDWENAAKNYRAAIDNQPEMFELYLSLAEVEARRNNFDEAVKNLDAVLELTNDEAQYVKKKIEILKKAGRASEIEAEKAKLPAEKEEKKTAPVDRFAEAQKLQNTEKEAARRLYREAFEKLLENPLDGSGGELKAANITAYVQSVREEEPLNQVHERLWQLREKLIAAAGGGGNSTEAVEARKRLATLDAALSEAVGGIAKSVATDEEIAALRADLQRRLEDVSPASDPHRTAALIQDLSRRAGFGDLEETILLRKLDESSIDRQINLQNLLGFYNGRGAYRKAFDALEKYGGGGDNPALRAEAARLVNNREKELEALREIYWKKDEKISVSTDANVARYLEILHAENREELKSLTGKSSARQLQLVNFLLGKGERELAHAAIENANLPPVWKISRHAETSLALKEFDENAECYFCDALQFDLIGNLIKQKPDKTQFLINSDWFRLTREYGEWLAKKNASRAGATERKDAESEKYMTALVENYPRSGAEQAKLGDFYLRRGSQPEKAIEHFRLAVEINDEDRTNWARLGAAYHAAGRKDWARDCWRKALDADDEVSAALAYFRVLQEYGLGNEARENLPPVIVTFLRNFNADKSEDFQNLIRLIAASFDDEAEKAAYFRNILKERPTDTSLAAMLVGESLIGENQRSEFYELLIARSGAVSDYDYDSDFRYALQRVWAVADAESIYEQENDYQPEKPENERLEHQKNYLAFLVAGRENARAEQLIAEIEKSLTRRYARPGWLRLAKIRIAAREGKFDRAEAERFTGIAVSDAATEIKPPGVERFNDVLQALREEKRETEAAQISEAFFARNLALGQFDAANFAGLSRTFFQTGEPEKAVRLLQLMIDVGDSEKKETALAEIAALDAVKTRGADAAKLSNNETFNLNQLNSLQIAAEIAAEFRQTDAAIAFRRQMLEANPRDATSRIEIAGLLAAKGEKQEAANLLTQIIADRNSPRAARWRARMLLLETGASAEFADVKADAFSQFYKGLFAAQNGRNETAAEFFINSLIADKDAETDARAQLIKLYVLSNQPFAALKFAEADKSPKSDEMLQTLSEAAEKTGDYGKAVEFEKAKPARNEERIRHLENLYEEKNRRATDLTVDLENTRKL